MLKVVWDFLSPHLGLDSISSTNPFAPIFLLSGHVTESSANDPRYTKSHLDLPFLAYYVIFFSFVRQILVIRVARPLASYFGIRKESKIDRFGEQFYALIYFTIVGAWGYVRTVRLVVDSTYSLTCWTAHYGAIAHLLVQDGRILARSVCLPHRPKFNSHPEFVLRLSSLGSQARAQALLPHAVFILATAVPRSGLGSREATERLL